MSLKLQAQVDHLEERLAKLEELAIAVELDVRAAMQGELFDPRAADWTNTLTWLGIMLPELTALPDPDEEAPFVS